MKTVRVGIIGQGRSGWNIHGETIIGRLDGRFRITAVCDPRAERCEEAKKATGCAVYDDYRKLLADRNVDLVVNATMSADHEKINVASLEAGFDTLCEKPLARTVASVDRQAQAAQKAGKRLFVFQQSRFAPGFVKVREVIASGVLGRIVQVKIAFNGFARRWDWQTLQAQDAGNLLNTGPHPLDQALQFFGDADPEQIVCAMDRTDNTSGDAEDHVKLLLRGKGHPDIEVEISSCAAYSPYMYNVYGTRGGLMGGYPKLEWKWYDAVEAPPRKAAQTEPLADRQYCGEQLAWYQASWENSTDGMNGMTWTQRYYEDIHDALVTGREPTVTLAQVRRQIAVIEECHRQNPLPPLPQA